MSPKADETGRIDYGRRKLLQALSLAGLVWGGSGTAIGASGGGVLGTTTSPNGPTAYPDLIPLPDGFQPEGIVTGREHEFFAGSLADGSVYRGDLRTGEGEVLVSSPAGAPAVGLSYDSRSDHLFVAGGPSGQAFVYDATTGEEAATYEFNGDFVNDVVVTRTAAYFTDSFRPFLYRVPLGPGGRLPDGSAVEEIALGGDFEFVPGPFVFNSNGIDAPPDGGFLIVVNSTKGLLYKVDPETGDASLIDLGGAILNNGDGILLDGRTLYVVQNQLNQIAVVSLEPGAASGEVVGTITDPDFDVPTTVAEFGSSLYAVNARFGTPPTPTTEYDVVRVPKKPTS